MLNSESKRSGDGTDIEFRTNGAGLGSKHGLDKEGSSETTKSTLGDATLDLRDTRKILMLPSTPKGLEMAANGTQTETSLFPGVPNDSISRTGQTSGVPRLTSPRSSPSLARTAPFSNPHKYSNSNSDTLTPTFLPSMPTSASTSKIHTFPQPHSHHLQSQFHSHREKERERERKVRSWLSSGSGSMTTQPTPRAQQHPPGSRHPQFEINHLESPRPQDTKNRQFPQPLQSPAHINTPSRSVAKGRRPQFKSYKRQLSGDHLSAGPSGSGDSGLDSDPGSPTSVEDRRTNGRSGDVKELGAGPDGVLHEVFHPKPRKSASSPQLRSGWDTQDEMAGRTLDDNGGVGSSGDGDGKSEEEERVTMRRRRAWAGDGTGHTESRESTPLPSLSTLAALEQSLDAVIPYLFEVSRLLSVVPALIGTLYNIHNTIHPPSLSSEGPNRKLTIDYIVSTLWTLLTGIQCLALTTGLLSRWQTYYSPLSTLIRLLAFQAICWPATHFTLQVLGFDRRPIVCWAVIGTTTCFSRSVQLWVTSNLRDVRDFKGHRHQSNARGQRSASGSEVALGRRRWDWVEVGLKCALPAGFLYFVTAWALLLKNELRVR